MSRPTPIRDRNVTRGVRRRYLRPHPGAAPPRTACWSCPTSPRTVGTAEGERVNQHERRTAALRADRERHRAGGRPVAQRRDPVGLRRPAAPARRVRPRADPGRARPAPRRPGPGRPLAGRPVVPPAAGRATRLPADPPHPPPVTVFHVKHRLLRHLGGHQGPMGSGGTIPA